MLFISLGSPLGLNLFFKADPEDTRHHYKQVAQKPSKTCKTFFATYLTLLLVQLWELKQEVITHLGFRSY